MWDKEGICIKDQIQLYTTFDPNIVVSRLLYVIRVHTSWRTPVLCTCTMYEYTSSTHRVHIGYPGIHSKPASRQCIPSMMYLCVLSLFALTITVSVIQFRPHWTSFYDVCLFVIEPHRTSGTQFNVQGTKCVCSLSLPEKHLHVYNHFWIFAYAYIRPHIHLSILYTCSNSACRPLLKYIV